MNIFRGTPVTSPAPETLMSATYDGSPPFTIEGGFLCKVLDIYDGDTFTVATVLPGFGLTRITCRLQGIDTAEMKYSPNALYREELKDLAYRARNRVAMELVTLPENFSLESRISRNELRRLCSESQRLVTVVFAGMDKYGRCLATVPLENGVTLSEILISENLGLEYSGGTKGDIHSLLTVNRE